jgi:NAD(P)-dependent dehydrogenase (short-subunit alcohol dehydrogenase family)
MVERHDELALIGVAGQVALVTGGGAGIGLATAELLAQAGMTVVVAEIDAARAEEARRRLGEGHLVIVADVRDAGEVDRVFAAIRDTQGRLDVVVNNVGDFLKMHAPFEETTEAQWHQLYLVLLHHVFLVTRAAIPMIKGGGRGGSVINISTIEAFRGIPNLAVYAAFKAALTGFTQSLAVELGQHDIRVNAVAPETTNSAQVVATPRVPPENRDYIGRWFPIGRFGEGADTAGAVLYLASPRLSGWVTGTTIHVDGGALAAGAWARLPDGKGWTHLPIITDDGYTPRR